MTSKRALSRRRFLKGAVTAAGTAPLVGARSANSVIARSAGNRDGSASIGKNGQIVHLASISDVLLPASGRGFMKFSYDLPEPSVEFGGCRFGFRIYSGD